MTRFAVALLATCACLFDSHLHAERPGSDHPPTGTLEQLRADVKHLASEELRGRSVADETIHQAADYIVGRMDDIGLETRLFDGSPLQELEISLGAQAGPEQDNRVTFSIDGQSEKLIALLDDGMNPMTIGSENGNVQGPVVFVGYGITAPKFNYDDYQGIDATGATVIVLRKEPGMNDPNSPFNGTRNTPHAYFATKINNAVKHGAAALIFVNDPASVLQSVQNVRTKIRREKQRKEAIKKKIEQLPKEASNSRSALQQKISRIDSMLKSMQEDLRQSERGVLGISDAGRRQTRDGVNPLGLPALRTPGEKQGKPDSRDGDNDSNLPARKDSFPVASVARDLIDDLLVQSIDQTLDSIEKSIDKNMSPASRMLANVQAIVRVQLTPTSAASSNVVGTLVGRGPLANESIIVGAHYDHVGMGGVGSLAPGTIAIHNGADDNASGTATMLSTARILTDRLKDQPSHRRIVFIAFTGEERGLLGSRHYVRHPRFSLESTAVMLNLDMVGRIRDNELTIYGTGSADLLDQVVENANSEPQFKLFKVESGDGPSDHHSFYHAGVPVLFFFTGLHNDYHRPSDDFEKIDFGGMVRITGMVSDIAYQFAIRKERPRYVEPVNRVRVRVRRQLTAYIGVTLSDRGSHVVISGLGPDGPASRAGIRVGDRLEQVGKRRVKSSQDVLAVMRERSPGDRMPIHVRRNGKKIEFQLTLAPRP